MDAAEPQASRTEGEADKRARKDRPAKVKRSGFVGAWSSGRGDLSQRVKDTERRRDAA